MQLTSAWRCARRRGRLEPRRTARCTCAAVRAIHRQSYLDAEWPEVGYCVGVFRMEGRGVQLFERIDGDHFTILGMPLIPLLGALARARAAAA
jgi:septum formation protein